MQYQLFKFCFLILISLSNQEETDECSSLRNPSKEICNNISPLGGECCFVERSILKECKLYDPKQINYEGFEEDFIKDTKITILADHLLNTDEKDLSDNNKIINYLESTLKYTENIECKTFSKKIDYSTMTFSNEDIEIGKKDNFCGKLIYEEKVNENQCLNGVVFDDLAKAGEKCCYSKLYIEEGNYPNLVYCLSLSRTQRENINSIKFFLPSAETDYTVDVVCDGFQKEYISSTDQWVDNIHVESCQDLRNPSSEEECHKIKVSKKECCYIKDTYDLFENSYCFDFSPEEINYESYVEDTLKYIKIERIYSFLKDNGHKTLSNEEIIKELKEGIPSKETIECRTFSKTIDYSTITYTNEDIEIAKQDNFCGKLMYGKKASEELCSNGIVFGELKEAGEKCCYVEVYSEKTKEKNSQCLSLSQAQRSNEKYLELLISRNDNDYLSNAKIVCDGFKKQYSYINGEWIGREEDENRCNMGPLNLYLLILLLVLLI